MRKGFIHVLEAGIAVLVLISTIIYITPKIEVGREDESYRYFYFLQGMEEDSEFWGYVKSNNVSGLYSYLGSYIESYTSANKYYVVINEYCYYVYSENKSVDVSINGSDSIYVNTYINGSGDVEYFKVYNSGSGGYKEGSYTNVSFSFSGSVVGIEFNSTYYPYKVMINRVFGYGEDIEGDVGVFSYYLKGDGCFKELKIRYGYG